MHTRILAQTDKSPISQPKHANWFYSIYCRNLLCNVYWCNLEYLNKLQFFFQVLSNWKRNWKRFSISIFIYSSCDVRSCCLKNIFCKMKQKNLVNVSELLVNHYLIYFSAVCWSAAEENKRLISINLIHWLNEVLKIIE